MKRHKLFLLSGLALAIVGLLILANGATGQADPATQPATQPATEPDAHATMMAAITEAVCVITPTEGSFVAGVIRFVQDEDHVHVTADLSGLTPDSEHAWHIHEFGDVTDPSGKAAGGHYNPESHKHGLPDNPVRHAGDFGNLTADENGRAHAEIPVDNITIAGIRNPIIGRGMIIHAQPDDGGQPTGNAGARIGQGVIGIAKADQ